MRIIKSILCATAGAGLLLSSHTLMNSMSNDMEAFETGKGEMSVLYNGQADSSTILTDEAWFPQKKTTATVEIFNDGDFDFTADVTVTDTSTEGNMLDDFQTKATLEDGAVVYDGSFSELDIQDIPITEATSETITLNIQWLPDASDDTQHQSSNFKIGVTATQ